MVCVLCIVMQETICPSGCIRIGFDEYDASGILLPPNRIKCSQFVQLEQICSELQILCINNGF